MSRENTVDDFNKEEQLDKSGVPLTVPETKKEREASLAAEQKDNEEASQIKRKSNKIRNIAENIDPASISLLDIDKDPFKGKKEKLDPDSAIYERLILVLPYRNNQTGPSDLIPSIYRTFQKINMQCLSIPNITLLNIKEFTDEEKSNRLLDYLSGFELIDSEMRLIVMNCLNNDLVSSMRTMSFYLARTTQQIYQNYSKHNSLKCNYMILANTKLETSSRVFQKEKS